MFYDFLLSRVSALSYVEENGELEASVMGSVFSTLPRLVESPSVVLFGGSGTSKRWNLMGGSQVIGDMPLEGSVEPHLPPASQLFQVEQVFCYLLLP